VFSALWEQRFSVIVVALLAVMAAGQGSDVLEQMPDVQRAWLTWPPGIGWVHAALAATAQLLLATLLVFLGRMRTRRAEEKFSGADGRADPSYAPWIAVPAVLALLAVALRLSGAAEVSWWRLGAAIAVLSVIAASSALIRWSYRRRGGPRAQERPGQERTITDHLAPDRDGVQSLGRPLPPKPEDADDRLEVTSRIDSVRTAGDALAVAVIAVTGVGLVRSFAAPGLLADDGYTTASWIAVAVGIAVASASRRLADGPVRGYLRGQADRLKPDQQHVRQSRPRPLPYLADWARQGQLGRVRPDTPDTPGKKLSGLWAWLVVGAPFVIADVCLLFVPLWATHWLGVLATAVIAVSTLAVVLAVLAYLAQTRRPLPLFRMIRLNVTPVITIIAVIGLAGGLADSRPLVHQVRGPVSAAGPAGRASLLASLQTWLADPDTAACAIPAAGTIGAGSPVRVEPLILAAAAGGGIRAAWWAENALAKLAATRCGQHDVFAVSSVSGGSLGMAILDTASPAQARAYLSDIAGPDALAAGVDGLLLHDLIAGYTGLDLPAAQMPPGQKFSDRAGLIESAWQNADSQLKLPFPLSRPALPWRLLFNSTTAGTGCRAIIADRSLPTEPAAPSDPSLTCDLRSSVPGGASYDFFAELPCMQDIATVTAAMLSARFPYITPSGVVTCPSQHGVLTGQFVDGGYVDSSGLITLADLMPSLIQTLQAHNATAVSHAQPGQPVTLVVPVVVYLGNSPRPVPVTSAPSLIQEPLVPLDAKSSAASGLLVSDTLLQRLRDMIGNGQWLQCDPATPGCAAAETAAETTILDQIYFVSPHTQPRIAAPLGWVLSTASQKSLDSALSQEESQGCLPASPPALSALCKSQPGVGLMADLLQLIKRQ
jgi:hypothetical protein